MSDVRLPKWGVSMTEATVVRWHRVHGEYVREGDALVDLETDKVETTMDAPSSGTVVKICVDAGESVPVGTVLAVIE